MFSQLNPSKLTQPTSGANKTAHVVFRFRAFMRSSFKCCIKPKRSFLNAHIRRKSLQLSYTNCDNPTYVKTVK